MKKESVLYGVIGLLTGVLIAWGVAVVSVNNNFTGMMNMMGMHNGTNGQGMMHDGDMTMGEMSSSLQSKTDDDFDENFIAMMIAHHEGAIDMAKLAGQNAKHQEVKDLAKDIQAAQSKEIDTMQTWQSEWGYKIAPTNHMMGH